MIRCEKPLIDKWFYFLYHLVLVFAALSIAFDWFLGLFHGHASSRDYWEFYGPPVFLVYVCAVFFYNLKKVFSRINEIRIDGETIAFNAPLLSRSMPVKDVQAIRKIEEYGISWPNETEIANAAYHELSGWHYEFMTKTGKLIIQDMNGLDDIVDYIQERNPWIRVQDPGKNLF